MVTPVEVVVVVADPGTRDRSCHEGSVDADPGALARSCHGRFVDADPGALARSCRERSMVMALL